MATLPKNPEWVAEIDGVNIGDPVAGGEAGPVNIRLSALAKRTEWLKAQLADAIDEIAAVGDLVGGIDVSLALLKNKNLADVPNKATARANLGVATIDHTHDAAYLKISASLGDVPNPDAALDAIGAAAKGHTHEQYSPYFIGEYKLMAHDNVPASSGFVKSNGALYDPKKYPIAFAIFGTKHGGNGITTFAVPDWRADAIRINDDGRGIDSGRVLGSEQGDAIRNITAQWSSKPPSGGESWSGYLPPSGAVSASVMGIGGTSGVNTTPGAESFKFNASDQVPTASENRMRNRTCCMYVYIGRLGIDA